jgi:hypothetical protein
MNEQQSNNPATGLVVQALDRLAGIMREVRDNLIRREAVGPGKFDFWPGGYRVQPQIRVKTLCVSPIASFAAAIMIGTNREFRFTTPANGVVIIPAEIVINRGETITIIDEATGQEATAVQVAAAWLHAYVDTSGRQGSDESRPNLS